ncbi:WAT1-related protein At1g43650 isoform X2 [Prosopis cineraria]|uniref:WAT1-related protein At1g43650 isoform X2 n=1 Tax=Prosopis cineraria TaxID=364024 RepID=UPI00241073DB|nr:WAT1-related protein At1g43650 isoform X2 [Prosopis cineraria]
MKGSSLSCSVVLQKNKPYIAMIFIQFVYAGMALLSKAAISKGMNPYVFVVYRQAFASIALSPFAFFDSKQATSLSYTLLWKIFFISLFGLTLSSSLYYVSINYTTATFAAASTNTVPAITFIMAVILRVESISIKHMYGVSKILGSVLSLSGAIVFALVKGPPLEFMKFYAQNQENHHSSMSLTKGHSKMDLIKGPVMMLSANTAWSLWLILQGFIVKQYTAKFRLTNLQCFFSFIQSAVLAVALERDPSAWKLGWDINLLSVAYCGLIVTGICYWLQVCTIETKGPVFTAMFTPLALIITAIFSALLWKESLYWGSVGGAVLLVGGLYSVLWGKNRECPKQESHHQDEEHTTTHSKLEDTTLECIIQH